MSATLLQRFPGSAEAPSAAPSGILRDPVRSQLARLTFCARQRRNVDEHDVSKFLKHSWGPLASALASHAGGQGSA